MIDRASPGHYGLANETIGLFPHVSSEGQSNEVKDDTPGCLDTSWCVIRFYLLGKAGGASLLSTSAGMRSLRCLLWDRAVDHQDVERCRPQFAPWSSYGSARNVATSKLGSRAAVLSDIIGVAAMAMTLLSYPLGNRSAIDIVAQKME